jgi:hypothetical protein
MKKTAGGHTRGEDCILPRARLIATATMHTVSIERADLLLHLRLLTILTVLTGNETVIPDSNAECVMKSIENV